MWFASVRGLFFYLWWVVVFDGAGDFAVGGALGGDAGDEAVEDEALFGGGGVGQGGEQVGTDFGGG